MSRRSARRRASHTATQRAPRNGVATYSHTVCKQASIAAVSPCRANQIGEVNANLIPLLPAGEPTFKVHNDDAPTFYVNGEPERTNAALCNLEQDVGRATAPDPHARLDQNQANTWITQAQSLLDRAAHALAVENPAS